jgi:NitT/TauT family transport system permease protein
VKADKRSNLSAVAYGLAGFTVFALLWELLADLVIKNPLFLPSFSSVVRTAFTQFAPVQLLIPLSITLRNFGIGLLLAFSLAVPTGVIFGWYVRVRKLFGPLMAALYVAPLVAIMPAIILFFGVFDESKIVLVILAAFFPLAINVESGVKSIDPTLVDMARSFGASDLQIFRTIALQNSLPYTLAGLKLAIGRGLTLIIVAEMFASTNGIGYMINLYASTFQMGKMLVPVFLVVLVAITLIGVVQRLESHFTSWKAARPA